MAYLALLVALGGSAYAVTRIDSGDVANNSLKSKDLKDGKAVAGRDLRQDTLTGDQIRERRLDASQFSAFASGTGSCEPGEAPTLCGDTPMSLPTSSKVLAIASGRFSSAGAPAHSVCELDVGGVSVAGVSVGQDTPTHASSATAESFALSGVSPRLSPGEHRIHLGCRGFGGGIQVSAVSISAIAIGSD